MFKVNFKDKLKGSMDYKLLTRNVYFKEMTNHIDDKLSQEWLLQNLAPKYSISTLSVTLKS